MRKVKVAAVTLCLLSTGLLGILHRDAPVTVTNRMNCADIITEAQLETEPAATAASIETTAQATTAEPDETAPEETTTEETTAEEETAETETTTETEETEIVRMTVPAFAAVNAARTTAATAAATTTTTTTTTTAAAATTTAKVTTTAPKVTTTARVTTTTRPAAVTKADAADSTEVTTVTSASETEAPATTVSTAPQKAWQSQITYSEYVMLCNMVGHEYGANWVSDYDKALIVEVIMNRVHSSQFPNTIYGVLTQRNQFPGMSYYINLGRFSSQVTDSVKRAVELYFEDPSRFQHGYLFYTGDGWRNYFRTRY